LSQPQQSCGVYRLRLKKLVKKQNIEKNVEFLGFISDDEKYACYNSADIFVLPSLEESFGIVLLEAMACRKPVVASNVGGIPFVVADEKTGLLFESNDPEDLAEKIITLLRNRELQENMGRAGRERAKEFGWDKIAKTTVRLYQEIIWEGKCHK
jgi:glycosyltransferase involved in cell wall biosynthesis